MTIKITLHVVTAIVQSSSQVCSVGQRSFGVRNQYLSELHFTSNGSMIRYLIANHKPSLFVLIIVNVAVGVYTFQPSLKEAADEKKRLQEGEESKKST